jgi:outer membrane protein assembly factor BamB
MVIAYDPQDGRELWRVRGTTESVAPTALVGGGLVYSCSGRNGPIIAIRPGGSGDVTESHVVWKAFRGGPYIPSGLVYRNRLYLVRDSRDLACYNAGDGQLIWTKRLRGTFTASLVAAEGRIYAISERGIVTVFAAADSFQLLAQNDLDERCLATPAIAGGQLFIRTAEHLYCIPEE